MCAGLISAILFYVSGVGLPFILAHPPFPSPPFPPPRSPILLLPGLGWPFDFHFVFHLVGVLHGGILLVSLLMPSALNEKQQEEDSAFQAIV